MMKEVTYNDTVIYERFMCPGMVFYFPTCWGHHSCKTKDEAANLQKKLNEQAKQEHNDCLAVVRNFGKRFQGGHYERN